MCVITSVSGRECVSVWEECMLGGVCVVSGRLLPAVVGTCNDCVYIRLSNNADRKRKKRRMDFINRAGKTNGSDDIKHDCVCV